MKRDRRDNYPSARIPVEYIKARIHLVRKLEFVYLEAMEERVRECKEQGIEYLHGICQVSPDKAVAQLESLYLRAHCEAALLPLRLMEVERQQKLNARVAELRALRKKKACA